MSRSLGCIFILVLCLPGARVKAGNFSISWVDDPSTQSSDRFIQTVAESIPSKMRARLPEELKISFSPEDFTPVAWGVCASSEDFKSYSRDNLYKIKGETVILNSDLLAPIRNGWTKPRRSCLHGIDYNLALGAVYQAIAEIYDRRPQSISRSSSFDKQTSYVISLFGTRNKQRSDQASRKLFLGDEPRLLDGPSVAFTAEFENFQVDRDFYCRHPGMWNYLNMVLGANRSPPICAKPFLAELYDGGQVELSPTKIYRIEYVYAHPGQNGILEKFGHAMLRVVACAPEHQTPGPECENDFSHHYLLSFNGENIHGVMDGFEGRGVAKLYVFDYLSHLKKYLDEGREVNLLPLDLSPAELATLIGTAWDWNQRYREKWNHLNNNCVTQALDLLRASVPDLESVHFPFVTPGSLAKLLNGLPIGDQEIERINYVDE